jgi:anti-sigma factor RsiW
VSGGRDARERARLEAYRDGELSPIARFLLERRLRRDPAARRALEELDAVGALLREIDATGPEPDLWESIRLRLPAVDARRAEEAGRGFGPPWRRAFAYLALGGAVAAAAAIPFVIGPGPGEPAAVHGVVPAGSVRWIDSRGHPMMVLRDDGGGTIIWVPEHES